MEILVFFVIIALVILVIGFPIVLVIQGKTLSELRKLVKVLYVRIAKLENHLFPEVKSTESKPMPAPEIKPEIPVPQKPPVVRPTSPLTTESLVLTEKNKEPDAIDKFFNHIGQGFKQFFTAGNPIMKIGIVVLLFGVGFFIKFASDYFSCTIEVRLGAIALVGIFLLALGWQQRLKRRIPAMILQGGGVAILYMTIFAAAKMFSLISPVLALGLMVMLVVFSGILAIFQDSNAMATLGLIGGFLAPVLVATSSGNHIVLFTYYALLNVGVFGMAWFKTWRILYLLGFLFTFVISTTWGGKFYKPEYFSSTEPFLIFFFLLYLIIPVLFTLRQAKLKGQDNILIFGLPAAVLGMQATLMEKFEFGLAGSALALSAIYIILAHAIYKPNFTYKRMLSESLLAIGVVFLVMTIPLAVQMPAWETGLGMAGAALVWIGIRQQRLTFRFLGAVALIAAVICYSCMKHTAHATAFLNPYYLGIFILTLANIFSAYCLNKQSEALRKWEIPVLVMPILLAGLVFWYLSGINECQLVTDVGLHKINLNLGFITISTLVFGILARRNHWISLNYILNCFSLILVGFVATAFLDGYYTHLFLHWGSMVWIFAIIVQYRLLWQFEKLKVKNFLPLGHVITWLVICFIMTWEGAWLVDQYFRQQGSWHMAVWGIIPAVLLMVTIKSEKWIVWPIKRRRQDYLGTGLALLIICLGIWFLVISFYPVNPKPLSYWPLINAMDLGQFFVIVAMFYWAQTTKHMDKSLIAKFPERWGWYPWSITIFIWLNVMLMRGLNQWGEIKYAWDDLNDSILCQASISILWTITALGLMLGAAIKRSREVWVCGAVLQTLVVIKLIRVDLYGTGTIPRIVSFVAVGILMLIIGFFTPMPPRKTKGD